MGAIALTLRYGAMRNWRGVGAAVATLGDGTAGINVGDDGVVRIGMGVGGTSTGGGDGGRGSTEGARVNTVSVGVAIEFKEKVL